LIFFGYGEKFGLVTDPSKDIGFSISNQNLEVKE
jgi:hypothetical protein